MKVIHRIFVCWWFLALLHVLIVSSALAEETIIQQEEMSFEKCLTVILISENKLSIAPEITDVTDQNRIAVFKLIDGTLTINCDEIKGTVTVSTNLN